MELDLETPTQEPVQPGENQELVDWDAMLCDSCQ